MFKLVLCVLAAVAVVSAKPGLVAPLAYTAGVPAVAAYTSPVVAPLATSYQSIVRNYNGLPYYASPYTSAALTYPYASAYSAYTGYPYASAYSYPYSSVVV